MKRSILVPVMAVALALLLNIAAAQRVDTTKEKEAVQQLVTNYEDAWNRHDPKGLADQYEPDATWVNWFGAYYKGRQDIQQHYAAVHTTYFANSHYYTRSIEDLTFIRSDIAIAHIRTGLSGDGRYPGKVFEFRRTVLLTKHDGAWHILAGQNAKLEEGIK